MTIKPIPARALTDPNYIRDGSPSEALTEVHPFWMVETEDYGWILAVVFDGELTLPGFRNVGSVSRCYPCREDSPLPVPWPGVLEDEDKRCAP